MRQTKPPWLPHPPDNPDWFDYVNSIYTTGCIKIHRLREQIDSDGICSIPFECYLCEKIKSNFSMLTGDGVPLCSDCAVVPRPGDQ